MALIKPQKVTITVMDDEGEVSQDFMIGKFPADEGSRMLLLAAELFDRMARPKKPEDFKALGDYALSIIPEFCKYVEGISSDGTTQPLTNKVSINSYVVNHDMMLELLRKTHDRSNFFFSSEKLSKTYLSFKDRALAALTKTLTQLSASSSQKSKPRSKSSARSTT